MAFPILQYGAITGGDFSENELTITMESEDFKVAYKDVAVVVVENLAQKQLLEEFIEQNFK